MEVFDQFDRAVAKDQIYECDRLATEMEALAKKKGGNAREELDKRAEVVAKIRQDEKELTELLTEIKSNDGWKQCYHSKKNGITVHFKKTPGSPFISTKARKVIPPAPGKSLADNFVNLISLFAEVELMKNYFPRGLMKSHATLKEETKFSRFTQMRINMPMFIPVSNREAIIHGKGYDMTERSAIAIQFKSLPEGFEKDGFSVEPPTGGYTRIDIQGAYYLELLPDGGVLFENVQMLDLKLSFVPPMILNALSKGALPVEFIRNVEKVYRKFDGSKWESAIEEKPEVYEDVRQRLEEYLASHGMSTEPSSGEAAANYHHEDDDDDDDEVAADDESVWHSTLRSALSFVVNEEDANGYADKITGLFGGDKGPAQKDGPADESGDEFDDDEDEEEFYTGPSSSTKKSGKLRKSLSRALSIARRKKAVA